MVCLLGSIDATAQDKSRRPEDGLTYSARMSQQEITITVEPYLDEELVVKTFHKYLAQTHITPVKITIANGRRESIRLVSGSIRLIDSFGTQYRSLTATEIVQEATRGSHTQGRRPPIRAPIPIPSPRRNTGGKMRDLEYAIRTKELADRPIPSHGEDHGYLFFRINGGLNTWKGSRLYIPDLRGLKDGERLLFFELDLKPGN